MDISQYQVLLYKDGETICVLKFQISKHACDHWKTQCYKLAKFKVPIE